MVNVNDVRDMDAQVQQARAKVLAAAVDPDDAPAVEDCRVNICDTHGWDELPSGVAKSLHDEHIPSRDSDAIMAAFKRLKRTEWSKSSSRRDRLNQLRLSALRADQPLVDFSSGTDYDQLMDAHEQAGVKSRSGQRSYHFALTAFWTFLDGESDHDDYEWVEDLDAPSPSTDRKDPDEMLDESEVRSIRYHLKYSRDEALVEFLTDTGLRISAACQLRVGDFTIDSTPPTVQPNPDGETQKGISEHDIGVVDLYDSEAHIREWLNIDHPEAPDPPADAPAFPVMRGYDPDDRENCAASPRTLRDQIDAAAEKAGVTKPTNHHSFRHACVKRLLWKYEFSWEEIRDRLLWSDDSVEEMRKTYGRLTKEERVNKMRKKALGAEAVEDGDEEVTKTECRNCGRELEPDARFCDVCRTDQLNGPTGPTVSEEATGAVASGLRGDADDPEKTVTRGDILTAIQEDDELVAAFAERLAEHEG